MKQISTRLILTAFVIILQISTLIKCTKSSNSVSISDEKFLFKRPEPGNSLGIVPTVMLFIEREAKKTSETWRINKAFTTEETWRVLHERCDADNQTPGTEEYSWKYCSYNNEGITFTLDYGVPEDKNKTISYLAIDFEPYKRLSKYGKEEVCKLNEVFDNTVYIVLKSFSDRPKNDTFPRTVVDSVAVTHVDQLDRFVPYALSFFKDLIDEDAIYHFDQDDYISRASPYDCFVAIGSSASQNVIEEKCSFDCYEFKEIGDSSPEYEKYLEMVTGERREADPAGHRDYDYPHQEL